MSMRFASIPKLIVFDLDLTLWPFRLDKHLKSPFSVCSGGKITDLNGQQVALFHETIPVLDSLKGKGFMLGIASRIEDICGAYQLINLLQLAPYFTYREIYPGNKRNHFHSLQKKSGINFRDMLFFDDDERNIRSVSKMGVFCVHVPDGISHSTVQMNLASTS